MIPSQQQQLNLQTWLGGFVCFAAYVYMRINSQSAGEFGLAEMLLVAVLCAAVSFYLWWVSHQTKVEPSLLLVVGFAVLFRLCGLGAFPILEDDFYRFLWDGRQTIELGSAYLHPPAFYFDNNLLTDRWHEILGAINYPEVGTVYGPTAQIIFALAYLLAPGEIWALQLILILADITLIALLCKATHVRNVLLYAWSPLVIKEFAFSAHPDVVGALFLFAGWRLLRRGDQLLAGAAMALAVGVKIFALVAVPLILLLHWRAWFSMLLVAIVIAMPFGVIDAWWPAGLATMSQDWIFNAPIYLLAWGFVPLTQIKAALGLGLLMFCVCLFFKTLRENYRAAIPRVDYVFAALFICLPVLNPWYLIWLLPFAAVVPSAWVWLASVSVLLAYVSGINLDGGGLELYQQPPWAVALEYGVVLLAVFAQRVVMKWCAKS